MINLWNKIPLMWKYLAGLVLAVLLIGGIARVARDISYSVYENRLSKQEAIIKEATEKNLKLEGVVDSLSTQLKDVNTRLEDANNRLVTASENTENAKVTYIKVRNPTRPVFISADDTGKLAELTEALNSLYPDN